MITLYSSSSCHHCTELKDELIKAGIDFTWKDLDDESVFQEAKELCEKTGKTELPIVVKDGKIFNNPKIEELL